MMAANYFFAGIFKKIHKALILPVFYFRRIKLPLTRLLLVPLGLFCMILLDGVFFSNSSGSAACIDR